MLRHHRIAKSTIEWFQRQHCQNYDEKIMGSNGKPACKVCCKDVHFPKRKYCSSKCSGVLYNSSIRTNRDYVFLRDKGVCSCCGLDTERLIEILINKGACPSFVSWQLGHWSKTKYEQAPRQAAIEWQLEQWGVRADRGNSTRQSIWDMDHVIGVELYTGDPDELNALSNLQTLCIPCHKIKSARQTKHRAKRKKRDGKIGPKERAMREARQQK